MFSVFMALYRFTRQTCVDAALFHLNPIDPTKLAAYVAPVSRQV
ncbi:hypothetical protein [Polynucleobacter paneuropaeus]|nr:hypothetical protein [Polynucleobacter paneuropaeus]